MSLNVLSLFSGIDGLGLGLERAGMTVVGHVERDPFCRRVLTKHWPEVPKHDDVQTAIEWWKSRPRPRVDVVAGGPPCQPVSVAGRGLAQEDERWLWDPMFDIVRELRPTWVIVENVPGLRRRGLDIVLRDLRSLGHSARAGLISACAMGAPHTRERLFVLSHAGGEGRCPWGGVGGMAGRPVGFGGLEPGPVGRSGWPGEPGLRGMVDGVSGGVDRRRVNPWAFEPTDVPRVAYGVSDGVARRQAIGNAVVPQVAEHIGRLIVGSECSAVAA